MLRAPLFAPKDTIDFVLQSSYSLYNWQDTDNFQRRPNKRWTMHCGCHIWTIRLKMSHHPKSNDDFFFFFAEITFYVWLTPGQNPNSYLVLIEVLMRQLSLSVKITSWNSVLSSLSTVLCTLLGIFLSRLYLEKIGLSLIFIKKLALYMSVWETQTSLWALFRHVRCYGTCGLLSWTEYNIKIA